MSPSRKCRWIARFHHFILTGDGQYDFTHIINGFMLDLRKTEQSAAEDPRFAILRKLIR